MASKKQFGNAADRLFSVMSDNTTDAVNTISTTDTTSTTSTTKGKRRNNGNYARMSISLTPEIMSYLRLMASISGISVAGYIEALARQDMAIKADVYRQAQAMRDGMNL